MKIFSEFGKPLSRSRIWTCALINVFATPGLGSLIARRYIVGSGQLFFALAGFCLIMGWFAQKMRLFYGQISGTTLPADAGNAWGKWGLIFFAVAWLWTLITSIQLLLKMPKDVSHLIPPKIINPPHQGIR